MNALVVYHSYSGNTKLVAEAVAKALGADVEALHPAKPLHASGVGYVMWGLRQLVSQHKPALLPLTHDPRTYDLIVLGTPVWSYTFTPPVRTFLEGIDLSGKQVALFCCHGGNPKDTLAQMAQALPGCQVIGTADFLDPAKHDPDSSRAKATAWADTLCNTMDVMF